MRYEDRYYPDEPAGAFQEPPVSFVDAAGRDIEIRAYTDDDYEAVVDMYVSFDPKDRAQGIPPSREPRIRDWLTHIATEDCYNVVAVHDDSVIGHATLVPETETTYELAIFVLQDYQSAGIGTHLVETLLGHGNANGVEYVWLSVERWNTPAVNLYKKVGFETCNTESFELEMSLRF